MFKKSLLILSLAVSLSGSFAVTGMMDTSSPAYVYATDEDDEDYDYLEVYEDTEPAPAETAPIAAPETETASAKPHVLDSTPKTADFDLSPQLALSLGVFFLGISIFFLAQKKQQ